MEYFRTLPLRVDADELQARVNVPALPRLSAAIDNLIQDEGPDADFVESLEFFADSWEGLIDLC